MTSILNVFRTDVGKLRAQLAAARKELEAARRRREDLLTLPAPHSDIADLLDGLIDRNASTYPVRLRQKFEWALRKPLMMADNPGLSTFLALLPSEGQNVPQPADLNAALCYLFKDQVKAGVRAAIATWTYDHGPKKSERLKELSQLEKKIAELEVEEKAMLTELEALRNELIS